MRPANKNSKRYDVLAEIRNDPRASYRELMERLGLHSTNTVAYHIGKLQEEGLITKERYLSRSLDLADGRSSTQRRLGTVRRVKLSGEQLNKKRAEAARIAKPIGAFVPRKTKKTDKLQANIDKVVALALEKEQLGAGRDVVVDMPHRMRAFRVGQKLG